MPFLVDGSINAASVDRMIAGTVRSPARSRRRSKRSVRHSLRHSNYPLTLGVIMTPNVIRRIITDNASSVMLKHED